MDLLPFSDLLQRHTSSSFIVANGHDGDKTWQTFIDDVTALYCAVNNDSANRWALCFNDSYYMAVAFLALSHAKKTLILPGNLQPGALIDLSDEFDAMIIDDRVRVPTHMSSITLPLENSDASSVTLPSFSHCDISLTLFTSGSSGKPKAVKKTLTQLHAELCVLENVWGTQLADTAIISTVSHQHIYGLLFRVLWPLCVGRTFSRHNITYPQQLNIAHQSSLTLVSSPAQLKRLDVDSNPMSYCTVFSSGGPLPLHAAEQCERLLGQRPFEIFGSTETGGIAYRLQTLDTIPWQLFEGVFASINAKGCLRLRSPFIKEDKDYDTADLCTFHDDNTFSLGGRADRIVKIEEKRVSLTDVENRLIQHEWINDVCCVSLTNNTRQSIGTVVVFSKSGRDAIEYMGIAKCRLQLRQYLTHWFEAVVIPRHIKIVNEIPQNSQGKRHVDTITALFQPSVTTHTPANLKKTPLLLNAEKTDTRAILTLRIQTTLDEFRGHFPDFPIYPGVSQIDTVMRYATEYFNIPGHFHRIDKLKFEAPIWPEMEITLNLEWQQKKQRLSFSYDSTQVRHASGHILFRNTQ